MSNAKQIILPDGAEDPNEGPPTERGLERDREDEKYVSVIVKRTDETRRHPDDILESAIEEGLEQLERPTLSLFLSAVAAGLVIGFTAMSVAVVTAASSDLAATPLIQRILTALVYPLGFVVCIMSGAELFTEHTATAVYPVLDGKARVKRLLRLWALVLVGNLLGAVGGSLLQCLAEPVIGARDGYLAIGEHLVHYATPTLFISAMLAGWLMALGAWLTLATPPTVSQMVAIYVVTFLIGLGGLHHSIAGSAEMLTALFLWPQFTVGETVRFISVAVLGNLAGGSLFVAVLNYGHIRRSRVIDQ